MIAQRAPACRIVDTSTKTTARLRAALKALATPPAGIWRYVPLPGVSPAADIDAIELEDILDEGFGSFFVQHPRLPGWRPGAHDAEADARWAVRFAKAAGYAPLTHGYVDAEGMGLETTHAEAHAYNSQWAHVLVEEGYAAGLYDGYSQPETPEELYEIHDVTSYASDLANRRVAVRGTAMVQGPQFTVLGVPFDSDIIAPDELGETPYWTIAE